MKNYLEIVEYWMDQGYTEELACRLADYDTNPNYNADDYEGVDA